MIILVEGSRSFENYNIFMHGMGVALSTPNYENEIQVWSAGPHKINNYTAAFCNSSENFLKQKGFRINFSKVDPRWASENLSYVNYFAYFALPKDSLSKLVNQAKTIEGLELGIFKY